MEAACSPGSSRGLAKRLATQFYETSCDDGAVGFDPGRLTLEPGDHQASAGGLSPDFARLGKVERGLSLVGESQHGRRRGGLGEVAQCSCALEERVEPPDSVDRGFM